MDILSHLHKFEITS